MRVLATHRATATYGRETDGMGTDGMGTGRATVSDRGAVSDRAHASGLASGRANQKRRTRQALIEAVRRLLDQGATPTLEQVAEAALVSRATAYRYFRSIDDLIADAFLEENLASPEEVLAGLGDDPLERVLAAEESINELLLRDETATHLVARSLAEQWLQGQHDQAAPRPGRRLPVLDAALEPLEGRIRPETRRRLRNAVALAIGTEAVLSLRDVCGLDADEARATARWAVEAMVGAALTQG